MKYLAFGIIVLSLAAVGGALETGALETGKNAETASQQASLDLVPDETPQQVGGGGKDDEDPPEGGLATPEGPRSQVPVLRQTGGHTAQVPMEHGSCGLDCGTHVLAVQNGNLDVPFEISMSCPAGSRVSFLAYQIPGELQVKIVDAPTASSSFSQNLQLQPFSAAELEAGCQTALGGSWPQPGHHQNTEEVVVETLGKAIKTWGRCTSWLKKKSRSYTAEVEMSCQDQSWVAP